MTKYFVIPHIQIFNISEKFSQYIFKTFQWSSPDPFNSKHHDYIVRERGRKIKEWVGRNWDFHTEQKYSTKKVKKGDTVSPKLFEYMRWNKDTYNLKKELVRSFLVWLEVAYPEDFANVMFDEQTLEEMGYAEPYKEQADRLSEYSKQLYKESNEKATTTRQKEIIIRESAHIMAVECYVRFGK